jgi:hypothetical protein
MFATYQAWGVSGAEQEQMVDPLSLCQQQAYLPRHLQEYDSGNF